MKAKTNQTTKCPPQRRRAEDELEWFFGYAESALRHDRVAMLPTYAAARARVSEARPKAQQLARTVLQSLGALPRPHAVVLRAAFTPRSWPRVVHEAFERLAPLVVRLFGTQDPWPGRGAHQGLEDAVALQLAARLRGDGHAQVEALRVQAQGLLESALIAYAAQRRQAMPGRSTLTADAVQRGEVTHGAR